MNFETELSDKCQPNLTDSHRVAFDMISYLFLLSMTFSIPFWWKVGRLSRNHYVFYQMPNYMMISVFSRIEIEIKHQQN